MHHTTSGFKEYNGQTITPAFALIFHTKKQQSTCAVTMHKVKNGALQIGEYIDPSRLKSVINECTNGKDNATGLHLNLPQVLVDNTDHLVWHTKASRRELHIRANGGGIHASVYYPALLFIATKTTSSIRIFALASSSRPRMDTILYNAPFHNIDGAGKLCLGSAPLPRFINSSTLPQIESAFFDANGTHTNNVKTLSISALKKYGSLFNYWSHKAETQTKIRTHELTKYKRLEEVLHAL